MILLGGMIHQGGLEKEFSLRPLTGYLEIAITDVMASRELWPRRLSKVLQLSVEAIGGRQPTYDQLHDLCVGDRQWLVRSLVLQLGEDLTWFTQTCGECKEKMDFSLRYSELPVKPAGEGFPYGEVTTSVKPEPIKFRVVTGRDQEWLQSVDPTSIQKEMVNRLNLEKQAYEWTDDDIENIEQAIENASPEVGFSGQVECPNCNTLVSVTLDPYARLRKQKKQRVFEEVDKIARTYHWSEQEILNLTSQRRRVYLDLIDQSEGTRQGSHHAGVA
ncbi:MAG: hypothetical protein ACSHX0_07800 [Akkermansiaceae bacterium]